MSSIVTAIPSGTIRSWCLAPRMSFFDNAVYQCANTTLGQQTSDFESICCNGDIIDITQNLFQALRRGPVYLDIENLVCCGLSGPQAGGISPIDPDQKHCTAGSPTPLASLAATNVENAAAFLVTYTSASYGDKTTGDFIPTQTPSCLWMNTNTAQTDGVAVRTVTVAAAQIITLPAASTDEFGQPVSASRTGGSTLIPVSTTRATSSSSSISAPMTGVPSRSSSIAASNTASSSTSSAAINKKTSFITMGAIFGIEICFLLYTIA